MENRKTPGIVWNEETPWKMDSIRYRDGSQRRALGEGGDPFILAVDHHNMTPQMREEVEARGWLPMRVGSHMQWLRPDMEKTDLFTP